MKMNTSIKTVDQFIKQFPPSTQKQLKALRAVIKKEMPKAVESISYGMPGYKLDGKPAAYFGAFKNHIGFYPTPSGMSAFSKELSKYTTGKGSAQFPLDKPLPMPLIKKILKFRVKAIRESSK